MTPSLTFLGSGSAFTTDVDNHQSNLLLRGHSGAVLLIDCGSDVRRSLFAQSLAAHHIDAVYVSHLHADHVGGLEWLGFSTLFDPGAKRPGLYVPEPLVEPLWENVLSGGMRQISGTVATLHTYFDVRPVAEAGAFDWDGVGVSLVPTTHVISRPSPLISYGLCIRGPNRSVYLTTDTIFEARPEIDEVDLVFHDCETERFPTDVHPQYAELKVALSGEARAKTWLYGYQPGPLPDATGDGFCGFVTPGQSFSL